MKVLIISNDGKIGSLDENALFDMWLYFYDMFARNVVEVVDDSHE